MATTSKMIYYKLEGYDEVFSSAEWCLESNIISKKFQLGCPIWTNHTILKDYDPNPTPDPTPTTSSSVSNPDKPTVVPKRARSRKTKQTPAKLRDVSIHVDDTPIHDIVPAVLRDHFLNGLPNAVPPSVDIGPNV